MKKMMGIKNIFSVMCTSSAVFVFSLSVCVAQNQAHSSKLTSKQPALKQDGSSPMPSMDLPKSLPIYPGAKNTSLAKVPSRDGKHAHLATFETRDAFEKVTKFYEGYVVGEDGAPGFRTYPDNGGFPATQGWFTSIIRGTYRFRVFLQSVNGITQIQYLMDSP